MNQDFSILTLVLHASFVVQIVMAGLLFGVGARDPLTMAVVAIVLASVAMLAS